jgi:hypothetical protein
MVPIRNGTPVNAMSCNKDVTAALALRALNRATGYECDDGNNSEGDHHVCAPINLPAAMISPEMMIATLKDSPSEMKIGRHDANSLGSGKEIATSNVIETPAKTVFVRGN